MLVAASLGVPLSQLPLPPPRSVHGAVTIEAAHQLLADLPQVPFLVSALQIAPEEAAMQTNAGGPALPAVLYVKDCCRDMQQRASFSRARCRPPQHWHRARRS